MAYLKIISVVVIEKFKLQVVFSDGTEGIYDASHLAGKGVFKIWDIYNNFENVFISPGSGAMTWPGAVDIDTINVYCNIKGISADTLRKSQPYATH